MHFWRLGGVNIDRLKADYVLRLNQFLVAWINFFLTRSSRRPSIPNVRAPGNRKRTARVSLTSDWVSRQASGVTSAVK